MENIFFAKVGFIFRKKENPFFTVITKTILILFCLTLFGCANSRISRDVASDIDKGVENTRTRFYSAARSSLADTYQNSSQKTKGALIGGTTGGVLAAFSASTVGIIPGAAIGAVIGASYGAYLDNNISLEDQIQNRGATIVVLGDQILISMPSSRLFYPMSSRIKQDAFTTLYLMTCFINGYTKMLVKIAAYTSAVGNCDVNLVLSQEQAENISKFFVASGIDARVLYAVGYGGTHLVSKSNGDWEGNDNY